MANGFRLFPLAPGELRRSDPDIAPAQSTIAWISDTHGLPVDKLHKMTAAGQYGTLQEKGARGMRRWVVSMQYSRMGDRRYGLPYCPLCLREDEVPFFRLSWRCCMHSHCIKHGTLLLDKCIHCDAPTWPGLCVYVTEYEKTWSAPHQCPRCNADLREGESDAITGIAGHSAIVPAINLRVVLNSNLEVSAKSYGDAVWILCQLFVRRKSANQIIKHSPELTELVKGLGAQDARCVEEFHLALRHQLTSHVHKLFDVWPHRLAEFCHSCGITAVHFSQDRWACPDWFEDFIQKFLCVQKRGIGLNQVRLVCDQLDAEKEKVTKAKVAKKLGASSAKAIDQLLNRRRDASHEELLQFAESLKACAMERHYRQSSGEVRQRDALVLLFALLSGESTEVVSKWTRSQCMTRFAVLRTEGPDAIEVSQCLVEAVEVLIAQYDYPKDPPLLEMHEDSEPSYFRGFRGALVPPRSLQKTLTLAMRKLDFRLLRSLSVFTSLARPGSHI